MLKNLLVKFSILTIVALMGYASGRYLQPPEVQVKTETVEIVKKEVRTVVKEVIRPDGTRETETIIDEHSNTSNSSITENITSNIKPQWTASGLMGLQDLNKKIYGAMIQRRILGPAFMGIWGTNNKELGVSISLEF